MRFVQFHLLNDLTTRLGLQKSLNGAVVDLTNVLPAGCRSLVDALNTLGSQQLTEKASSCLNGQEMDSQKFILLAPVTQQDKLACVGMNYKDHCEEQGAPVPVEPLFFCKFPSSAVGPTAPIPYPEVTQELDWEVELAVVIGKRGKNIPSSSAAEYIFGYSVAHDVSARDWQMKRNGGQWLLGKTGDGYCPMGPCVITADELGDPHNLKLSCTVNGVIKQNSNTNQLVHNVYDCVAWLSRFCTLLPGDVILTGTPPGVGVFAKPPQFLKKGDVVECQIEKIGTIRNQVI